MTPGARVAAAIEILDDMSEGLTAEQALTRWARRSRFAGSKDRAAIRDYVFDVQRCRSMAAHYGQGETGRSLMIGLLHLQDADMGALFNAVGHAPAPLTEEELDFPPISQDRATLWNLPEWLLEPFESSLGETTATTAEALQNRAPIHLRANLHKADIKQITQMLKDAGIETTPNPIASTALTVLEGNRKLRQSSPYLDGFVELQDGASQAAVEVLPDGVRVLDYCAGGGGKALALAMQPARQVFAHDIDPKRMNDLETRAERAGVNIPQINAEMVSVCGPYDIVLCDVPCTGSGAWRRAPDAKWKLTPERIATLNTMQDTILDDAAHLVAEGGTLAYATCSVLRAENQDRISAFLERNPLWRQTFERQFPVNGDGDGFYTAHLTHVKL